MYIKKIEFAVIFNKSQKANMSNEGTIEKIVKKLSEVSKEHHAETRDEVRIQQVEIISLLSTISKRLEIVENLSAGNKKAINRAPKAAEGKKAPAKTESKINNILTFFKFMYKSSEEFREKFLLDEVKANLEKDDAYNKKEGIQKITHEGDVAYKFIRANRPDIEAIMRQDFDNFKKSNEEKQQLEPDAVTPTK
jgi:hypothetical protein